MTLLPVPPGRDVPKWERIDYALDLLDRVVRRELDGDSIQLALGLAQLQATLAVYASLEGRT